jgi:hypothetical protein
MLQGKCIALSTARGDVRGKPISLESIEELPNRDPARLDRTTVLQFGDQPRAFDRRLPLRSLEAVPAALALAGLRITHVDDDGPVAGRPLAKMPPHFESSLLSGARCSAASASAMRFASSSSLISSTSFLPVLWASGSDAGSWVAV